MNYVKKITFIVSLIVALFFLGCKSKLDLTPYNQVAENESFSTPERCLESLNGVYDAAQSGTYDPLNGNATQVRGYPFGAASIEQDDMRGEDMVNIATFYSVTYQNLYSPTSPNNVNMFKELYAVCNKANLSIEGFRDAAVKTVITTAVASQYEAECRFLRAMSHHELLIHFARPYADGAGAAMGVAYRDFPIDNPADVEILRTKPRETVGAVYTKILADLDYAETNLPATLGTPTSGLNTYRATKAAAIALKMRVKLHMGDWAGVLAEGNKLIPAVINPLAPSSVISPIGGWGLADSAYTPFTNNISTESIFSIKNDALDNPGTNGSLARMYGSNSGGGRGLVTISPIIWNAPEWTCTDKRRRMLYTNGPDANNQTNKFTKKYTDVVNQSDYAPLIRYAEVLLTQAEAEARNNPTISQRAIDLLNTVRNRSLSFPLVDAYTVASFANNNALINAILKERRIEFLAEGKRWGDIHRLAMDPVFSAGGIPAKMANGFANIAVFVCSGAVPAPVIPAVPYADYRFIWPIPQDEINTNPITAQNPLY